MGAPFFILASGQSNIYANGAGVPFTWSPSARAKVWNNVRDNDMSVGNAYRALSSDLIDISLRYASNVAAADPNKDVYLANYSSGGRDILYWTGGMLLNYPGLGAGEMALNAVPESATVMSMSTRDAYNIIRYYEVANKVVGEKLFIKQGSKVYQYTITTPVSWDANQATFHINYVSGSGGLTAGGVQVEFQPRLLSMIENSVPVALAAAGKSEVDVFLWWQGESDSEYNTRYEHEFEFVISYLSAKPWWSPNTKIIICAMNSTANNGRPEADPFNARLAALVAANPTQRRFANIAANVPSDRWQDVYHMHAQGYADAADYIINSVYAPPVSAIPSYSIVPSTASVVEGGSVTFAVNTTNVGSATLYWTNSGTTVASDFSDGQNSGAVAVSNNAGSFTRALVADGLSEGAETIVMQLRTGSINGPVVATSSFVSVSDSAGGGGGTSNIVSISVGALTTVMDVTTNAAHGYVGDTPYGLWPDGPARPYRDHTGQVYFPVPHSENYRFRVPSWDNPAGWVLEGPTMLSARDTVEGHYNNRHWVFGIWSTGANIYALTHHEWYNRSVTVGGVPGFNALNYTQPWATNFNREWVNGVGLATSTNGGATFSMSPNDNSTRLVLIPEPWGVQQGRAMYGFFHPSNIVNEGSYYYACVEQRSLISASTETENSGMSLIRTSNPASPTGWEYWGGSSWVGISHSTWQGNSSSQVPHRFFPYAESYYTNDDGNGSSHMGQSLRYHTPTEQWIVFGFSGQVAGPFFGYSTSKTLANPQFTTVQGISGPLTDDFPASYISVFDKNATDPNFMTIGNNITVMTTRDASRFRMGNITITTNVVPSEVTYSIIVSASAIVEGGSVTYTVNTTNFGNGTLYWVNAGTTAAADFSDGQNSGSVSIVNNTGTFSRTVIADGLSEGAETIVMQLRTGSISGPVVATAETVTVAASAPSAGVIMRFKDAANGSWIIATAANVKVRNAANTGWISASPTNFKVRDATNTTWLSPIGVPVAPTYSIGPSVTTVNEGGTVTYTVNTTNVTNGTPLWWSNYLATGYANGADFTDGQVSGAITINNNTASFTRTLANDQIADGNKSMVMRLHTGSSSGAIVATASAVTINDTSVPPLPPGPPNPYTLSLARNDLDFIYARDAPHTGGTYLRLEFTLSFNNFFAVGAGHIPICINAKITVPNTIHCGPITRNGRDLFSYGRGFFIAAGTDQVYAEHWNGTTSPGVELVPRIGGTGFSPAVHTQVQVRVVGGLRTGFWANQLLIYIRDMGGNLLFHGSRAWGWDAESVYMAAIGGIGTNFVSPNNTGCVEKTGPGNNPTASATISDISFTMI